MTRNDLLLLWSQLTQSAQKALLQQAELLVAKHSGTIELRCHKGGVRLIKIGKEYRPGEEGAVHTETKGDSDG